MSDCHPIDPQVTRTDRRIYGSPMSRSPLAYVIAHIHSMILHGTGIGLPPQTDPTKTTTPLSAVSRQSVMAVPDGSWMGYGWPPSTDPFHGTWRPSAGSDLGDPEQGHRAGRVRARARAASARRASSGWRAPWRAMETMLKSTKR